MTNEFDLQDYIRRGADRLDHLAQGDPQISRMLPLDAVTASIQEPGISYHEIIARTLAGYAERPAIGVRGYDVRRIDDHGEWVQRFSDKMRNLPDAQRQQSSLAIMGHLEHPDPGHSTPASSARFEAAIRRLPAGPHVPQLTEPYIHKYLHDLHLAGLITAPERATETTASARHDPSVKHRRRADTAPPGMIP